MRTRCTWLNLRALLRANYLAGTVCGCASPAKSSHECCWMRRGWTVTMAMCKPRLLFVWTETSSAALNRLVTPAKARANARLIAPSSVVPRPIREQARPTHVKCQSIRRIMVSKTAAVISSTSAHFSPTDDVRGSRRSGKLQPLRRKTECGFTLSRFSNRQAPENCRNRSPDQLARGQQEMKNGPQGNPEQNPMGLLWLFPDQSRKSRLHRAGFQVEPNEFL
jgi:hypothetical protein